MSDSSYSVTKANHRLILLSLAVLLLASLLATYFFGDFGIESKESQRPSLRVFARVYNIADLVPATSEDKGATRLNLGALIDDIEAHVAPETWISNGGSGSIVPDLGPLRIAANRSITVFQTERVHKDLEAFLRKRRAGQRHSSAQVLMPPSK